MHIAAIKTFDNNRNVSFKANLYNTDGENVKSFDLLDQLREVDLMKDRGGTNTDIFIKEIISKKNTMGGFDNEVNLSIKNPLFDSQELLSNIHHETNSPIDEAYASDLLTRWNKVDNLENKALKLKLIDEVKRSVRVKDAK